MKVTKFTIEYKETRSDSFQSVTMGLSTECVLDEDDDYDTEFAKMRTDLYKRVAATTKKALKAVLVDKAALTDGAEE